MIFKSVTIKKRDFLLVFLKLTPFTTVIEIMNLLLSALIPAITTIAVANFIDTVINVFNGQQAQHAIILPLIIIFGCVLYDYIRIAIADMIYIFQDNAMKFFLRPEVISKKTKLEYKHIEDKEVWELINRVTQEPEKIFFQGKNNLFMIITMIVQIVSLLGIVMSSVWWVGIVMTLIGFPLFKLAMKLGKRTNEQFKKVSKIERRLDYFTEILTDREHAQERLLFSFSPKLTEKWLQLFYQANKIHDDAQLYRIVRMKLSSLLVLLVDAFIIFILMLSLRAGMLSIGMFIAVVTALLSLIQRMSWELAWMTSEYSRIGELLNDFNQFVELTEKDHAESLPADMSGFLVKSIEFKNVSFKYPHTDHYVLKNCSFYLDGNSHYAFVGVNGSGKTTIIKLLTGLYDDYEGQILINDQELNKYSFAQLKGLFALVFQDFAKYEISLEDNIMIGNPLLEDNKQFEKVIKELKLKEILRSLPAGVKTPLGKILKNSKDLSVGQWQRLALARLLYANKKINILDEPTAALDPMAESEIYKIFHEVAKNKFVLYITHRMGAAKIADQILVIDKGTIIEQGSHEELLAMNNGKYAKMYNRQKWWYF